MSSSSVAEAKGTISISCVILIWLSSIPHGGGVAGVGRRTGLYSEIRRGTDSLPPHLSGAALLE